MQSGRVAGSQRVRLASAGGRADGAGARRVLAADAAHWLGLLLLFGRHSARRRRSASRTIWPREEERFMPATPH